MLLRRPLVGAAAALGAVYVIWGSTYLAIAVAVRDLPPLLMLSLRFTIAGGILYAWSSRGARRPTRANWRAAFVVGGLLLVVDTGAVAWAEQRLDTGLTALLCATVPLWLVGIDGVRSGTPFGRSRLAGLAIGLLGVAILVGPSASHLDLTAVLVVVLGTLAWAGGTIYARSAPLHERTEVAAGMEMLAAGLMLGVAGAAGGELRQVGSVSPASLGALAFLIVFGSIVAYTAYAWLLRNVRTHVVATHAYVNPAVAVLLGCVFLGEPLSAATVLAALLVVVSVVLLIGIPRRTRSAPLPRAVALPVPPAAELSSLAA
jgi:drug/metabolite transporter (DMT)-like permease